MIERRQQTRDTPSEDIRRYRGDWILHELTQLALGHAHWTRADGRPLGIKEAIHGRYHQPTGLWDMEAGEQAGGSKPSIAILNIPASTDIDFPGEHVTVTRGYIQTLWRSMSRELQAALQEYIVGDWHGRLAFYAPSAKRVKWTDLPTAPQDARDHQRRMRNVVRHLSDEVPYQPFSSKRLDTREALEAALVAS